MDWLAATPSLVGVRNSFRVDVHPVAWVADMPGEVCISVETLPAVPPPEWS